MNGFTTGNPFCLAYISIASLVLMAGNAIFKLDNFNFIRSVIILVEIAGLGDSRIFDIQTIVECFSKVVFKNNILECTSFFIKRRSGHFKAENRAKLVDCLFRSVAVVAMCLVHQYNKVRK